MKLKFSRTILLVLGVGIPLIVLIALGVIYIRQSVELGGITKSLAQNQANLAKIVLQRTALESQLAQQQSKLDDTKASLSSTQASLPSSSSPPSVEYAEVLSQIAQGCGLEVVSMTAGEPSRKKMGDVTFTLVSFEVEVRGAPSSMIGMVNNIAKNELFNNAGVELMEINVPQSTGENGETVQPMGKIKLVSYNY
jgi:hypothetical protein